MTLAAAGAHPRELRLLGFQRGGELSKPVWSQLKFADRNAEFAVARRMLRIGDVKGALAVVDRQCPRGQLSYVRSICCR
jgi:hypothetical protein